MSNEILPGTIDCDPGTLSGSIFAALNGLVAPADQPLVEFAFKQIAFGVASGWFDNVVDSITDLNYLRVDAGAIVGAAGGGGGGAPTDATYLVQTANGSLSAERVATDTATLTWDFATPGQFAGNVPTATTSAAGVVELATDGEAIASRAVQGNDSRLTNARTPTAHASSHENGGGDEISVTGLSGLLADGQTPLAHAASHSDGGTDPVDITDLAGFPGGGTTFLRDDGTFATPAGGSGIVAGVAITLGYIP
jgi:hypothetical protein